MSRKYWLFGKRTQLAKTLRELGSAVEWMTAIGDDFFILSNGNVLETRKSGTELSPKFAKKIGVVGCRRIDAPVFVQKRGKEILFFYEKPTFSKPDDRDAEIEKAISDTKARLLAWSENKLSERLNYREPLT